MKIEFSGQSSASEWISMFASRFRRKVENGRFNFPQSLGDGFMQQFEFAEGLSLNYLYFNLKEPLEFIRHPSEQTDLIPVFFYTLKTDLDQKVYASNKKIGLYTENGVYISSPEIGTTWSVPAGVQEYQVTLSFSKKWLERCLKDRGTSLSGILDNPSGFYLFESLSDSMKVSLEQIHNLIVENPPYLEQTLHAKTLELMVLFLQQVERRPFSSSSSQFNQADVANIFRVRRSILELLPEKAPIAGLAKESGMSVRKLQSLFKQVFGRSISSFIMQEKMNLARRMLDAGELSVTEIGLYLGYTNLSHFTDAFRKHFGINPKKYIS